MDRNIFRKKAIDLMSKAEVINNASEFAEIRVNLDMYKKFDSLCLNIRYYEEDKYFDIIHSNCYELEGLEKASNMLDELLIEVGERTSI